ncbi:MAG: hypothetical protein J7J97_00185 [Thermococcus sp.]|nr:hypothetical protein [Thermococcus sp.]
MGKLRAAFIFLAPEADPKKHRAVVETPAVELHVVGVKNYEEACKIAKELVNDGIGAIELCGGFGHKGAAKVVEIGRLPGIVQVSMQVPLSALEKIGIDEIVVKHYELPY